MKCVILAGGSGSRFWPLSRRDKPKQLLNIVGNYTMLQMTVDRLVKMKRVTDIYIITRADLRESIIDNVKSIKPENIIAEPNGKNTAPAIGLICSIIGIHNKDSVVVLPFKTKGHNRYGRLLRQIDSHLPVKVIAMLTKLDKKREDFYTVVN